MESNKQSNWERKFSILKSTVMRRQRTFSNSWEGKRNQKTRHQWYVPRRCDEPLPQQLWDCGHDLTALGKRFTFCRACKKPVAMLTRAHYRQRMRFQICPIIGSSHTANPQTLVLLTLIRCLIPPEILATSLCLFMAFCASRPSMTGCLVERKLRSLLVSPALNGKCIRLFVPLF